MTRAEAIEKAIDMSGPGDSVTIHDAQCTNASICTCQPQEVYIGGRETKNPLGFQMHRD